MTPHEIHDLNRVLAEVCGIEIFKEKSIFNITQWNTRERGIWTPCTDHNQMALVKAKLREQKVMHNISWARGDKMYCAEVGWEEAKHESELVAFAKAVKEWYAHRLL